MHSIIFVVVHSHYCVSLPFKYKDTHKTVDILHWQVGITRQIDIKDAESIYVQEACAATQPSSSNKDPRKAIGRRERKKVEILGMILNFNLTVEICGDVSIGTAGNKSGAGATLKWWKSYIRNKWTWHEYKEAPQWTLKHIYSAYFYGSWALYYYSWSFLASAMKTLPASCCVQ